MQYRGIDLFKIELGLNIKDYRMSFRKEIYTQEQLSEDANISPDFISRLECGLINPSAYMLLKICNSLDITPNHVLYEFINNKSLAMNDIVQCKMQKLSAEQKEIVCNIIDDLALLNEKSEKYIKEEIENATKKGSTNAYI